MKKDGGFYDKAVHMIDDAKNRTNYDLDAPANKIFKSENEQPKPSANVVQHERICTEMNALYARKNRDYGDSFHISFEEEGMAMARIRLGDKLNRFKTLTKAGDQLVQDESIRDTLIDLANYAIMTVMEIDRMGERK